MIYVFFSLINSIATIKLYLIQTVQTEFGICVNYFFPFVPFAKFI